MPITANTPSQDGITISRSIQWFMSPLSKSAQSATQSDGSHHMWGQNYYLSLVICEQDPWGRQRGLAAAFLKPCRQPNFGEPEFAARSVRPLCHRLAIRSRAS
jgi:hypothetical protein